jgi:hypothetical protein
LRRTWSCDGIYRLTNEAISLSPAGNNGSVGYGLDPVGNRQMETSSITGLPSGNFTFNADDQLTGETYDNNGNTLTTGGKSFAYDAENKLISMNGGAVRCVYVRRRSPPRCDRVPRSPLPPLRDFPSRNALP